RPATPPGPWRQAAAHWAPRSSPGARPVLLRPRRWVRLRMPRAARSSRGQGAGGWSKPVLPVADGGEHAHRVGGARAEILVRRLDHRRLAAAKERIGGLLVGERRGQRRLARIAQTLVALLARAERAVARLDRLGEADVRQSVFVAAVDLGVVGQRGQLGERGEHLLGGAFEEPPAAAGEQRVAAEERAGPIIGNVRAGMARDVENGKTYPQLRNADAIAFRNRLRERRDRLLLRPEHRHAIVPY